VVIFATNFFSSYDPAFLRRIFAHVELPLPDEACRRELWRRLFPGRMPGIDALDLAELAARSEGLSGGDLLELVKRSASRAVQRSGGERRVTQADVLQEIEALRRTRRAHEGAPRWTPSDRDGPLAEDADRTA
jgi:SpoVK/Ycf46/Vps4 family AAA+-type ATPase